MKSITFSLLGPLAIEDEGDSHSSCAVSAQAHSADPAIAKRGGPAQLLGKSGTLHKCSARNVARWLAMQVLSSISSFVVCSKPRG
eukprot:5072895-Pleurochrysis_carterae.AAC.1